MAPRQQIPVDISHGEWTGGDAALIPNGYVRRLRDLVWENGWRSRPPFTYDGLANVRSVSVWYDETARAARLIATDVNAGVYKTYVKAASGETWSADVSGSDSFFGTITDSVSYHGKWLATAPDAVGSSTPLRTFYYDGTTYTRDAALPAGFRPACLTTFIERVIYGAPLLVSQNLTSDTVVYAYDLSLWTLTNATSAAIDANGTTLTRVTPTNVSTASVALVIPTGVSEFFGSTGEDTVQFRCELRGTDKSYDVPVTVQIKYAAARNNLYAYTEGQVIVPATPNGFRYRATVGGTSAAAPPVYPTTVGGTVVDGTVTWINDGSDVAAETPTIIPNLSKFSGWTVTRTIATIAAGSNTELSVVIKFGTASAPTYSLTPLDFSFLDGRDIDDPQKQNHGQQVSYDAFEHPFYSNEDVENFVIDQQDSFYWSEALVPLDVRAQNRYTVRDVPGRITGIKAVGDSLVVSKRNARWVFQSSEDVNYVVLPVGGVRRGAGWLNPKACDIADDGSLYYVGENGVYRWGVNGEPVELCGEGMLHEMFSKNPATWCESQAAPANRALLVVDQHNKCLMVYVQKGIVHRYDIRGERWSRIIAGGDSTATARGYQICDMAYNPNPGSEHVYIAFTESATGTAGLARLDATQSPAKDQISSSGTLDVHHDLILKPVEGRPRVDLALDQVFMHVDCSVANQMASAQVSFDQGATFEETDAPREIDTTDANYEPMRFSIWQSWGSMTPRILVSGKAGASALKISGLELDVRAAKKPEYPKR